MSEESGLNERGNHHGEFTQGVGGWAEYAVHLTETNDTARHDVTLPPSKVIPVIFLPGVMGSNLRMSKMRQHELDRDDNRSWRPDDLMGMGGKTDVVMGTDLGGWLKNASPAQRQLNFDPNETEVEYYHYTESEGRFDPEGKETLAADIRHRNVPDSLGPIPPLLGQRLTQQVSPRPAPRTYRKRESPAQLARWRGWSEVLFAGAYGNMLRNAEMYLNNMIVRKQLHAMWRPLLKDPRSMGATSGAPLTEDDIKQVAACWYPVHAMGYNFLKSNGESAKVIAARIRGVVKGYRQRGFQCKEVIVVTHSMGGLLGRALLHPKYGAMQGDSDVKILGMYHSVMPSTGAAATYKRMRFGFLEGSGMAAEYEASVLGINGEHATAILANAPGPLELLPASWYGANWLKIIDGAGRTIASWPREEYTALDSIYLQPESIWWRLINPKWVNPGNVSPQKGGGLDNVLERLAKAANFTKSIESTFHPTHCYASYCSSSEHLCYAEVVFKVESTAYRNAEKSSLPPIEKWKLTADDGKGTLRVSAGSHTLTLTLQPARSNGDATVPAERSARSVGGMRFQHGEAKQTAYDHQNSFSNPSVLESMLYSVVQIAKSANWGKS